MLEITDYQKSLNLNSFCPIGHRTENFDVIIIKLLGHRSEENGLQCSGKTTREVKSKTLKQAYYIL